MSPLGSDAYEVYKRVFNSEVSQGLEDIVSLASTLDPEDRLGSCANSRKLASDFGTAIITSFYASDRMASVEGAMKIVREMANVSNTARTCSSPHWETLHNLYLKMTDLCDKTTTHVSKRIMDGLTDT